MWKSEENLGESVFFFLQAVEARTLLILLCYVVHSSSSMSSWVFPLSLTPILL